MQSIFHLDAVVPSETEGNFLQTVSVEVQLIFRQTIKPRIIVILHFNFFTLYLTIIRKISENELHQF